jgi:hypothetical protein
MGEGPVESISSNAKQIQNHNPAEIPILHRDKPNHILFFAQFPAHLAGQFLLQGMMRPERQPDKALQPRTMPIILVSNRLHILAIYIRQQNARIHPRIHFGVVSDKYGCKWLRKLFQALR